MFGDSGESRKESGGLSRSKGRLMWVLTLAQNSNQSGLTTTFWVSLAVTVLPTLLVLALMTLFRREFKNDYPHMAQFDALKSDVESLEKKTDALPLLVAKTDTDNRESRNAEFGRLRDSIDSNYRELRGLIQELRIVLENIRGGSDKVNTDFRVFAAETESRINAIEKENERLANRRDRA